MRFCVVLLVLTALAWLAAPMMADTLPPDPTMQSQGCTGSFLVPNLIFIPPNPILVNTVTINDVQTTQGGECLENTSPLGTTWNTVSVTIPTTELGQLPPDALFTCDAIAIFANCTPPGGITGDFVTWTFFGGAGVPVNTHVEFDVFGLPAGAYDIRAFANVPEPATMTLVAVGAVGLLRRRFHLNR